MAVTAQGRILTDWNRRMQAALGLAVAGRTLELAAMIDPANIFGNIESWLTEMLGVQALAQLSGARQAGEYVNAFRVAEVGPVKAATMPVATFEFDMVEAVNSVMWAPRMAQAAINTRQVDPYEAWAAAYRALSARQQWEAVRPGRRLIIDSARLSGHAWRRVSDGHPCAFCAMLVTRGPAYWSMDTAGFQAHHYCGCTAEEYLGPPNGWQPTDREQEFIDLYNEAHQPGMDGAQTAAAMRAQGQGVVNDARAPQTQTGGAGGGKPPKSPKVMSHPDDDPSWSSAEKAIANFLRSVGYQVGPGGANVNGRLYDYTLNGVEPADGKSPDPGASSATMRNSARQSVKDGGQARTLIFDLRGTGCDEAEARSGVVRIRGLYGPNGVRGHVLARILVIGDDYYFEEVL